MEAGVGWDEERPGEVVAGWGVRGDGGFGGAGCPGFEWTGPFGYDGDGGVRVGGLEGAEEVGVGVDACSGGVVIVGRGWGGSTGWWVGCWAGHDGPCAGRWTVV